MRVLFISGELIAADLAYRLKKEGCDVKLYIEAEGVKNCLNGMVAKTDNWEKDLKWVGKNGLIVFDDVGYGATQDKLRKEGYSVIGGSEKGDRLELDRIYGQEILKSAGVVTDEFNIKSFTLKSAIAYVKKNPGEWVIKQNDHNTALNYVGRLADGSDVLSVLESYKTNFGASYEISLQKRVHGIEIAIGRFFNGKSWVGPSVINREHKHLNNGDIGPVGGETGTLMWYDNDENKKLFQKTLAKLTAVLKRCDYRGYIDINCIVANKDRVYPLEITSRFGSSTNQTQSELQISPWREFLTAVASGTDYRLRYKREYGLTVVLTVPPFPYRTDDKTLYQEGVNIFFNNELTKEDFSKIHFEGVLSKRVNGKPAYYTSGNLGYVLYITGSGKTIFQARERVYRIVKKIIIPKMFYRTDIGLRFMEKDHALLKKWGWF